MRLLVERNLLRGSILDYGCGYGIDGEIVRDRYDISSYGKYNIEFKNDDLLNKKHDTVYSVFAFNAIDRKIYVKGFLLIRLKGKVA